MKCPLCGLEFKEEEGQAACKGCLAAGSCHLIKCPNCGYEVPIEPALIKKIRKWKEKRHATEQQG